MSLLEMQTAASDLRVEYDKRLMLVSGRANRELAAKIGRASCRERVYGPV